MFSKAICKCCGKVARPRTETPGSLLIEIFLWCWFLVPGLIYTLWRMSKKHKVCRTCGSRDLVPRSSPIGRRLAAELDGQVR
ncbi:hypothetical protein PQ43W_60 [Ralstonia phage PQ43W]